MDYCLARQALDTFTDADLQPLAPEAIAPEAPAAPEALAP